MVHAGPRLNDRSRLLFGSLGEIEIARRHLVRADVNILGTCANFLSIPINLDCNCCSDPRRL
jgi:hypothetical protein